jgi:UDPglucose 6-dehydrogenase
MQNVGIIGQGFVGGAIREGFKDHHTLFLYDKFSPSKSNTDLIGVVKSANIIFICVPTPMDARTGQASTHIVEEVINEIDDISSDHGCSPTLIIKSTCPPGTAEKISSQTSYCEVMFSPEFLTEANAVNDFKNQNRIIIGTVDEANADHVVSMFRTVFPEVTIKVTNSREAEMCKYIINTFLSVKVSFANEIYDICDSMDIDYDTAKDLANLDTRLGSSHWMVPGPDGDRGFGGHCFPKDLQALSYMAAQGSVGSSVLDAAWVTNNRVRMDRDWESQEGRAIINSDALSTKKDKTSIKDFVSNLFA